MAESLITQPKQGEDQVTEYRREELLRLGFSSTEANRLAPMGWWEFNVQDARRMLERGATHSQVIRLLLSFD